MKNVAIITIVDNDNYGNRLQNYAVYKEIKLMGCNAITLKNNITLNSKNKFFIRLIKFAIKKLKNKISDREKFFTEFNKNIEFSKNIVTPYSKILKKFDIFIVGSDQVWNPNFGRLRDMDLVNFVKNKRKTSFSASFGIDELPAEYCKKTKLALNDFDNLSVREDAGKKIIEDLNINKNVEVLIDPTMMLTTNEWNKVCKVPKQISNLNGKKYILNYFLGKLSEERKNEIQRIATENDCEIINILDKNDPFFVSGPSEFLWLEKNAFLICTDSFHSSVFAILYNRPFVVFNREDKTKSMNSRIETLISKFNLKNREYNGKNITKENLEHDYTEAYKILEKERMKSEKFLKKALDIEE